MAVAQLRNKSHIFIIDERSIHLILTTLSRPHVLSGDTPPPTSITGLELSAASSSSLVKAARASGPNSCEASELGRGKVARELHLDPAEDSGIINWLGRLTSASDPEPARQQERYCSFTLITVSVHQSLCRIIGPNVPALFNVIPTLSFHLFVILRCCRLQFQFKSDLALALALGLVHGIVLLRVPHSLLLVSLNALVENNLSDCIIGLAGVARFEFFGDGQLVHEELL
ncbi:hypothetical protein FPRO04_12314 [Fusarium proliferatum]|nr:hypothetical protein FPRO04_12314 [Fusarium proliferatum]